MKLTRRQLVLSGLASRLCLRAAPTSNAPWLQDVQADRATLVWVSEADSARGASEQSAEASWKFAGSPQTPARVSTTVLADGRILRKARLEGLPAGTEIGFTAGAASGTFRTPGTNPGQLRFLAFGDSGTGSDEQLEIARQMEAESPDLVLHTGDIAYPLATDEGLEKFYFKTYRSLMSRTAFYPCPGNHDYADDLAPYRRWHALPASPGVVPNDQGRYYSFEAQGVQFLSLDSNDPLWTGGPMLSWIDAQLADSRAFWRIAYFHHPPYTGGFHAHDDSCRLAAERLAPRLEGACVPLVLNGHEHSYQRLASGPTTYIVSGGGGGGLYDPNQHPRLIKGGAWHHYVRATLSTWRMQVEAVGISGEVLDRVDIAPAPTLRSLANSAGFQPRVAPGSLASLFGYHLSATGSGVNVALDGVRVPVLGAAGGQLNLLLPMRAPGRAVLQIETPNGRATREIELLPSAPALFRDAQGRPLLSNPQARSGEMVRIYLTGSGGRRIRMRVGARLLGDFSAVPSPTLPGVEEVALSLPNGWEQLESEPI